MASPLQWCHASNGTTPPKGQLSNCTFSNFYPNGASPLGQPPFPQWDYPSNGTSLPHPQVGLPPPPNGTPLQWHSPPMAPPILPPSQVGQPPFPPNGTTPPMAPPHPPPPPYPNGITTSPVGPIHTRAGQLPKV